MVSDDTPTSGSPEDSPSPSKQPSTAQERVNIGPYQIIERLGSGGMGEVYKAEQQSPVRRTVALKLIKLGMDSEEVLVRFEAERQALALMNHPNIASVFDAGTTEAGRPFFAMEYVRGVPVNVYCDRYRLGIEERLELFIQICEGVQHAHQKGIIHRDLKPSNILVTIQDDRPVPKIIDFGVAKAITQPLTDSSLQTRLGSFIGTPEYMSPEQADMSGLDIDTRTDIYTLGAVLYELLVGERPFDTETLRTGDYDSIRRQIVEKEPSKFTVRLTTSPDPEALAEKRSSNIQQLRRQLKGELEWIVLKAMDKDRTRRYETANALALDIQRYLRDEPVRAGPPSTIYRVRKFVRRNQLAVLAGSTILLAIILAATLATVGLIRARAAEHRANLEAQAARQVSDFLVELFEVSDPSRSQGDTITARQLLDEGAARIERDLSDQPVTLGRLLHTIGTVYRKLGLYDESLPLLEKALQIRETQDSSNPLEVAETLHELAATYYSRAGYDQALPLSARALEIRKQQFGSDHPEIAKSLAQLGWIHSGQGKHQQAKPFFTGALEIREATLGSDTPEFAKSLNDVGINAWRLGNYDEAEELLLKALQIYERLFGPYDYQVRTVLNDLAVLYFTAARYDDAERLFRRSIEIKERVLGRDNTEVAGSLNNLAILLDSIGRPEEAQPLLERTLAIKRKAFGLDHEDVGLALANLAWIYYRQDKYDLAEDYYEQALKVYRKKPDSLSMAILLRDRALLHRDQKDYANAEQLLRSSLAIRESQLAPDHPDIADVLHLLGEIMSLRGKPAGAEPHLRRALDIRRVKLPANHPDLRATIDLYTDVLRKLGRSQEASELETRYGSN